MSALARIPLVRRFFGNSLSTGAGVAIGVAARPALEPYAQSIANERWETHAVVPPDVYAMALGVAQGQVEDAPARKWAAQLGYGDAQWNAIRAAADTGPGVAQAFTLWRRGVIGDAGFRRALKREGLEDEWIDDLTAIKRVLLSPAELANARQQGFVDDARQLAESELQGYEADEATILYELAGLPPGAATAQAYLNRGLIDDATFAEMIREGHTKTKYTDVLRRGAEYVLSPIQYVEARIRGWITDAEMYAGTHKHGVTRADTDLLFKTHGRPLSFHQTFIGTRRGGTLDGPTTGIDAAFLASLQRSNVQPPFYNLAWAQRYNYPSAFVLRGLTQSGDLTQAETHEILLFEGWEPTLAAKVSAKWAGGSGSAGAQQTKAELLDEYAGGFVSESELRDTLAALGWSGAALDREVHLADARRLRSVRERVVRVIEDAYRKHAIDGATALAELAEVQVSGDAATFLVSLWEKERRFTVRELTDRQVVKAVKAGIMTRDAGLAELEERGFSPENAAIELAI